MAKQSLQKRLRLYGPYVFKGDEKDPIIDVVHTALEDAGFSYYKASAESGVSVTAIRNWIEGDTKRPQYCTIAAVMGACGKKQVWVDIEPKSDGRRARGRNHAQLTYERR